MMDITKLADRIAYKMDKANRFLRRNWKTVAVVIWMLIVTGTLIRQEEAISTASSFNQVANLKLSLDDVRYSVDAMEADVETMQRAIGKMDNTVNNMQSTVNRIHTQVRYQQP